MTVLFPKVILMRAILLLVLLLLAGVAKALPIATLTFDVTIQGYVRDGNTFTTLYQPGALGITTAKVQFPWAAIRLNRYDENFGRNVVLDLGSPGQSAGVEITSPTLLGLLDSTQSQTLVESALHRMGVTGMTPSTHPGFAARDYVNVAKRDMHGAPDADRYYTVLDATIMRPSQDLFGIGDAKLLHMLRLNGIHYDIGGDTSDFGLADMSDIVRAISVSNRHGFNIQFTKTVDTYNNGVFINRPFEITYGGRAQLAAFTVDGVDMLHGDVPEPSSILLMALGTVGIIVGSRRPEHHATKDKRAQLRTP